MADFFTDLFNSIFTPGPTPTLVRATNVAFAGAQVVLLAMLAATASVHFAILSVLCAGLWWAINWFVREVGELKTREEQERAAAAGKSGRVDGSKEGRDGGSGAENKKSKKEPRDGEMSGQGVVDGLIESEDTETEEMEGAGKGQGVRHQGGSIARPAESAGLTASGLSVSSLDEMRKRRSTGDVSGTDSEWDKLESEVDA